MDAGSSFCRVLFSADRPNDNHTFIWTVRAVSRVICCHVQCLHKYQMYFPSPYKGTGYVYIESACTYVNNLIVSSLKRMLRAALSSASLLPSPHAEFMGRLRVLYDKCLAEYLVYFCFPMLYVCAIRLYWVAGYCTALDVWVLGIWLLLCHFCGMILPFIYVFLCFASVTYSAEHLEFHA